MNPERPQSHPVVKADLMVRSIHRKAPWDKFIEAYGTWNVGLVWVTQQFPQVLSFGADKAARRGWGVINWWIPWAFLPISMPSSPTPQKFTVFYGGSLGHCLFCLGRRVVGWGDHGKSLLLWVILWFSQNWVWFSNCSSCLGLSCWVLNHLWFCAENLLMEVKMDGSG